MSPRSATPSANYHIFKHTPKTGFPRASRLHHTVRSVVGNIGYVDTPFFGIIMAILSPALHRAGCTWTAGSADSNSGPAVLCRFREAPSTCLYFTANNQACQGYWGKYFRAVSWGQIIEKAACRWVDLKLYRQTCSYAKCLPSKLCFRIQGYTFADINLCADVATKYRFLFNIHRQYPRASQYSTVQVDLAVNDVKNGPP